MYNTLGHGGVKHVGNRQCRVAGMHGLTCKMFHWDGLGVHLHARGQPSMQIRPKSVPLQPLMVMAQMGGEPGTLWFLLEGGGFCCY